MPSRFAEDKDDFDSMRDEAVAKNGIVMPGLAEKYVTVVGVPTHDFNGEKPIEQAEKWAKENLVTPKDEKGKYVDMPEMNDGTKYAISNNAIGKYLNDSATKKSDSLNVHLSVLKKLKVVIHESIEAEVHPDYKKGEDGKMSPENGYNNDMLVHRLYGAVVS